MNSSRAAKPLAVREPYIRTVMEAVDADERSLRQIAEATGYTVSLLSHLRRDGKGGTKLPTLRDIAQVVGLKFVILPMGVTVEDAVYDPEEG